MLNLQFMEMLPNIRAILLFVAFYTFEFLILVQLNLPARCCTAKGLRTLFFVYLHYLLHNCNFS